MSNGFAMIVYSNEADKLMIVGILAQTAANLGIPVRIFATGPALPFFTKKKPMPKFSKAFKELIPNIEQIAASGQMPSWYDMLKDAKEIGDVKVFACSNTAQMAGIKEEDLDPVVDGLVGATFFFNEIEGYEVIFI